MEIFVQSQIQWCSLRRILTVRQREREREHRQAGGGTDAWSNAAHTQMCIEEVGGAVHFDEFACSCFWNRRLLFVWKAFAAAAFFSAAYSFFSFSIFPFPLPLPCCCLHCCCFFHYPLCCAPADRPRIWLPLFTAAAAAAAAHWFWYFLLVFSILPLPLAFVCALIRMFGLESTQIFLLACQLVR